MAKRARDLAAQPPSKRRRHGDDETATAAGQQEQVKAYMVSGLRPAQLTPQFHAPKLLLKALKKAQATEAQKLTRKLKQSVKDGAADATDLETQLAALKAVSVDPIPLHLLTTRLSKLIYLHPILPAVLAALPPSSPLPDLASTSAEGKGRNRILANKLVKEAWDEVVRAVAKRMGQEVADRPVVVVPDVKKVPVGKVVVVEATEPSKPFEQLSKRAQRTAIGVAKRAGLPIPVATKRAKRPVSESEVDEDEEVEIIASDSEQEPEDGFVSGSEEGEGEDDDEVMRELARLGGGSGSDEEDDPSDFFEGSDAEDDVEDSASNLSLPHVFAVPRAPKERESKVAVVKPVKPVKVKAAKSVRSDKPTTSSAFLPSLAGGYISYSDSDGEDAKWVKAAEKGDEDKKERKNRRGQRARQAIWEQKYGSGANHVVKTVGGQAAAVKGSKANRGDTRSAAKSAKVKAHDAPPAKGDRHAPFDPSTTRPGAEFNPNTQPIIPRTASKVEKGMHPSWEAKRRATEAAAALADAPRGKKITFG